MANELDNCVDAVAALLDEITTYTQVHKREPDQMTTKCEVAVLMDTGTHGQAGMSLHNQTHMLLLRTYMKISAYPDGPEQTIRQLWGSQVDKFNLHVTLNGTATRSNLEGYTTGYMNISGVVCRIMDTTLEAMIVVATAYA